MRKPISWWSFWWWLLWPYRKARRAVRRAFGACVGASVITETDELGERFFPATLVPVTTNSFVFTDVGAPPPPQFPAPPPTDESRLRLMDLDEDPPMVDLGNESGVFHLVRDDPGSGDIFGVRAGQVVRCRISPPSTSVLFNVGRPTISLAAAGHGTFALLTLDPAAGGHYPFLLTPNGGLRQLWGPGDVGQFFSYTLAVKDERVFVGGLRRVGRVLTAAIMSVPFSGGGPGFVRTVAELGSAEVHHGGPELKADERALRVPTAMVFLGSDLIVASRAQPRDRQTPGDEPEPSHLLRLRLSGTGAAQLPNQEIPVDVPGGFIAVMDLKALDGQLFIVDSRHRFHFSTTVQRRRILRVCPD